jgi:hypothetical protein
MNTNLFTTFYIDKEDSRNKELETCVIENSKAGFNKIIYFIENKGELIELCELNDDILNSNNEIINISRRPTFNDLLKEMNLHEYSNDINIISNSDIVIPKESLLLINNWYEKLENRQVRTCLALSRWNIEELEITLFDRADSQDTWIFFGNPKFTTSIDIKIGITACDNRFAFEIKQNGFRLFNPSKLIKTIHYHNSGVRNYLDEEGNSKEIVPPPYLNVNQY